MRYLFVACAGLVLCCNAAADEPSRCVPEAARYHSVNEEVLRSVLNIESRNVPTTVTRNSNGSVDVGLGGTNSIHFRELASYAVTPQHLLNACNSVYTTAWLMAKSVRKYGETWFGYAAFHSATPYFNHRYQVLIHNDLVRRGAKDGPVMPVPPLKPR